MSGYNDQHTSDNPDIFFRSVDRLQIESYLTALRQDKKSLVLLSKHPELLSYYGELVVKRISQEFKETSIEVLLPADTEGLLERFNSILNSLSFEVATKPNLKGVPHKIWLIQDANALGEKDIQILLKLIENFPGAGISAILMFETRTNDALAIFENNPKINTWLLNLPTPEQKLNTIQQARRNGTEEIAIEFFNQLAKAEKRLNPANSPSPAPLSAETDASIANAQKSEPTTTSATQSATKVAPQLTPKTASPSQKKILPWVIIVLGLLSISVGVSAVLHPELGEKILSSLTTKSKGVKALQSEDSSTSDKGNPSNKTEAEIPEVALEGQRWLMTLPEDHFVLEFQTFATAQEALKETEGKDWLKRTYVVPVRAEGTTEIKFLLVDGPFRTSEMAKKAASRMPNSNDIVIENVASLRGHSAPKKATP